MRSLGALAAVMLSGCVIGPEAIGVGLMAPAMVGTAGASADKGGAAAEVDFVKVGNDHEQEVEGGWGFGAGSTGYYGLGRLSLFTQGRFEVGTFGRDRLYGYSGFTAGPGLALAPGRGVGAGVGYRYGGDPQIGHTVPASLSLLLFRGFFAVHATAYAGWRFHIRDEYPAAAERFGAGWNSWGGDLELDLGHQGLAAGVSVTEEDDIHVVVLHIGGGIQKPPER